MHSTPDTQELVTRILSRAQAFLTRHSSDTGAGDTYGYFTRHPVAPLNRKRLGIMLDQLRAVREERGRPLRILDLACGGGLITCAVAEQGHRVLGLDLSASEIRLAKLFAQEEKLGGLFLQADLLQDPEWEKTVELSLGGKPDVVLMAYALHHLPGVEGFVERLSRFLAPGAVLLVNEENPESPLFRLKHRVRGWIQKDTDVEWHRTYAGWKELLEARGFQIATPLLGADVLPGLGKRRPEKCWSLVFTARRS